MKPAFTSWVILMDGIDQLTHHLEIHLYFEHPFTFNPSVARCCLCSTRALLGLNRLKARHWVWPRCCLKVCCWVDLGPWNLLLNWILLKLFSSIFNLWRLAWKENNMSVLDGRVGTKLTVTSPNQFLYVYQFLVSQPDMVVNRTWLRHSQNFSFSSISLWKCLASYQCGSLNC